MSAVDAAVTGSAPGIGAGSTDTPPPPEPTAETALARTLQKIARGDLLVVVMSFVFAFLIGSVLIIIADQEVRQTLGYFFGRARRRPERDLAVRHPRLWCDVPRSDLRRSRLHQGRRAGP